MRPDMKKKLVDCYRMRSSDKNADVMRERRASSSSLLLSRLGEDNELIETRHRSQRLSPTKTGMRMKNTWARKDFGENLAPLYRFLWSNRGRDWDDVYSDISKHCDKNSAVGAHIYEHLWGFVVPSKLVVYVDKKPHKYVSWFNTKLHDDLASLTSNGQPGGWENLYVCPLTNKLLEAPRRKKAERKQRDDIKIIDDYTVCIKDDNNAWFLVELDKQEYIERKKIVKRYCHVTDSIVEKKQVVTESVYTNKTLPSSVDLKLPKSFYRKLSKTHTWQRDPLLRWKCTPAECYVKTCKTMSKREKKQYGV